MSSELNTLVLFLFFLGVVLLLIFALAWVLKKINMVSARVALQGQEPRLNIQEAIAVDHRRKLVLVQRDQFEHLILIGGENDVLIERGIPPRQRQQGTQAPQQQPGPKQPAPQMPIQQRQPHPAAAPQPVQPTAPVPPQPTSRQPSQQQPAATAPTHSQPAVAKTASHKTTSPATAAKLSKPEAAALTAAPSASPSPKTSDNTQQDQLKEANTHTATSDAPQISWPEAEPTLASILNKEAEQNEQRPTPEKTSATKTADSDPSQRSPTAEAVQSSSAQDSEPLGSKEKIEKKSGWLFGNKGSKPQESTPPARNDAPETATLPIQPTAEQPQSSVAQSSAHTPIQPENNRSDSTSKPEKDNGTQEPTSPIVSKPSKAPSLDDITLNEPAPDKQKASYESEIDRLLDELSSDKDK